MTRHPIRAILLAFAAAVNVRMIKKMDSKLHGRVDKMIHLLRRKIRKPHTACYNRRCAHSLFSYHDLFHH